MFSTEVASSSSSLKITQEKELMFLLNADNPETKSYPDTKILLDRIWKTYGKDKDSKELFYCAIFRLTRIRTIGNRILFYRCLQWLAECQKKQFYSFLPILGEYYNIGAYIFMHFIRTDRYTGEVVSEINMSRVVKVDKVLDYIAQRLKDPNTSCDEKILWAKWLWKVPSKTRKRIYQVTEENIRHFERKGLENLQIGQTVSYHVEKKKKTKEKDSFTFYCIEKLSQLMGWEVTFHKNHRRFDGYTNFRTRYMINTEAVLFSTKKICEFTESQFVEWLEDLSSGARYNVQKRLITKNMESKNKWFLNSGENMGDIYLNWLSSYKSEKAQNKDNSLLGNWDSYSKIRAHII